MRRLTSIFKPRLRPWFALAAVAYVVLLLVVAWQDVHRRGEVPWLLVAASLPLIAGLFAHVRNTFATDMVDEAWIDGDELLLQRAGQSTRMPLTNIGAVGAGSGGLVTLEFCLPGALGPRARFITAPKQGRAIADELRQRVDEARRQHA